MASAAVNRTLNWFCCRRSGPSLAGEPCASWCPGHAEPPHCLKPVSTHGGHTLQVMHRWEVYITRGAEGRSGKAFVGAMTEEKSVELASKIASEGFVFAVREPAGSLLAGNTHDGEAWGLEGLHGLGCGLSAVRTAARWARRRAG